jgi:hypothetical protein
VTTDQKIDGLIASVEEAVKAGLAYFEGPGANSSVKMDIWSPREVLCHLIYWHQATAEGMESVTDGGDPLKIYASTDEMNARAVGRLAGVTMQRLIEDARRLQTRLIAAARVTPDPEATVLDRDKEGKQSARQRLGIIAHHWNEHLRELEELERKAS